MKIKKKAIYMVLAILCINLTAFAQNINLKLNNVTVKKAMETLKEGNGYSFVFASGDVDTQKVIQVDVQNGTVDQVIKQILHGQKVSYEIKNKNIIIQKDLLSNQSKTEKKKITGTVTDSDGLPIIGANIVEKGTTNGIITDIDGRFQLETTVNAILVISYIGYNTQEVKTENNSIINIELQEDSQKLEEVVVVGYGTQKKINLTGALSVVDNKDLENRAVSQVSQILQGQVPGLVITNTTGGDPDAALTWQIRGQGSPYVLVDGVPMDINMVNPNDIENISVLKDAASAAIYGARAAYGVVLITTKEGTSNKEKPEITYTNNIAWSKPTSLPDPMNSLEYATWWNEAASNSGAGQIFSDEVIGRIKNYMVDPTNTPSTYPDPTIPNKWGKMMYANANTNWYKVFFKDFVKTQQHNISISGNTKNSKYYVSAGLYTNAGQMAYGDDKYKRYTTSANFNSNITSWLRLNTKNKFSRAESDWPQDGYGGNGLGRSVLFHDIARRWPTDPVKTPDGQWGEMSRIHIYESGARDKYNDNQLWLTGELELEPLKNWIIKGSYTFNYRGYNRFIHQPVIYLNDLNGNPFIAYDIVPPSQVYKQADGDTYQRLDVYSTYNKSFEDHAFKVMLGYNQETKSLNSLNATKQNLITDAVPSFNTAIGQMLNGDNASSWATMGYFARINYNYKEKYLLELNGRLDGSYKYRKEDRWGFFPSISLAYRLSEEPYWKSLKSILPYTKLRFSYGSLGDQNGLDYNYLAIMGTTPQINWINNDGRPATVYIPALLSESLTWETLSTLNFGLDIATLNNRLNASFDIYKKSRTDIITTGEPLPSLLGTSAPSINSDAMKTRGWELSLNWADHIGKDWSYSIGVNLERHLSFITKTDNPEQILSSDYVGKRVGEIWGYESNGLFQSEEEINQAPSQSSIYGAWYPGDVRYADLNGDNIISVGQNTLKEHGDLKVIGNSIPSVYYNLKTNLKWKNIDLSMFWSGVGKYGVWFDSGYNMFWGQVWSGNIWASSGFKPHLDYWTTENRGAYFPRLAFDDAKNRQVSSRYLQNGAYFRLKNLQIGYELPKEWVEKIFLKYARLYVSGENLITFSSLPSTFDPEALYGSFGAGKIYPLSKSFSFGLTVVL